MSSKSPQKFHRSPLAMTIPSFLASVAGGYGWCAEVGGVQENGCVFVRFDRSEMQELITTEISGSGGVDSIMTVDRHPETNKKSHSVTLDGLLAMLTAPSLLEPPKNKRKNSSHVLLSS